MVAEYIPPPDVLIFDRDPDDETDAGYPVGTAWFNSTTNVQWRLVAGEGGNTWNKDVEMGGGTLHTGGGQISSGGGAVSSGGGLLTSAGGDTDTDGGQVLTRGGNIDGGAGNIVTSGGWLGTSDEFAIGLVGMWAGAADPTVDPGVGGFNRGTIWQRAAGAGELWLKTADDASQITRAKIANATGGTFTLVVEGTESAPIDFDYFGGDPVQLLAALEQVLPVVAEIGKSRAALGFQIDPDNNDLLISFLALWNGQPITVAVGTNNLTGAGPTLDLSTDQAGSGSTSWIRLLTTDDL